MHVLVLNVFFAPNTYGGATVVAEEVGRRLVRDHGFQVSAVSVVSRRELEPYAVIRGEVDGMATWLINLPPDRGYVSGYVNPEVSERIARIVGDIEPDIAHVHSVQDLGADCLLRLKAAGVPTIVSVHDFWWLCEKQFMIKPNGAWCGQSPIDIKACRGCVDDLGRAKARQETLLELVSSADLVTYPSHYARDLCTASGLAPDRAAIWENGIRPPGNGFFAAQARRRAMDGRLTFGFVGGPSRMKGWPIVHDAFASLETGGFRGLLVDGSRDGSWWRGRNITKMAGNWSVYPRYEQAEMDAFFAEIDVLLFLSQWKETYGLTIREAIARGIRVIQTDSGGTMEHRGVDPGRVLQIGDGPAQLRRRLEEALDSPEAHPEPIEVHTQADQAAAFVDLAQSVVSKGRNSKARQSTIARPRFAVA